MSDANDGGGKDGEEKDEKKKEDEAPERAGSQKPSKAEKQSEAPAGSEHRNDQEKGHEEQYDVMPSREQKKVHAIVKRGKRRRKGRKHRSRRSKSLTDLPQSKRAKKFESSAIHSYATSKVRKGRKGKKVKPLIDIVMSDVKTVDLELPPTEEEKNKWSLAKSTSSERSESCGTHRTEVALVVDNAFRNTINASAERIKLDPVKVVGGWYKPIYRFHVNRLQDVGRLLRKKQHVSKFPTIQKLILEAIHLPPLASERREEDLNEYMNVFIKAPLPAIATEYQKKSLLKELVKMVSLAFSIFSDLINNRNNFLKETRDPNDKGKSVGRFLAELLVILKNVLEKSDLCTSEGCDASLGRNSYALSTELQRIIQIVDLIQDTNLFQGQDDKSADKSVEQSNVIPSGNFCQIVRLMDSFKRMRLYAASMLLRLPTRLENVEMQKSKGLDKLPASTSLQVPADWIQEVCTSGTKAGSTNAVAIQINEQEAVAKKPLSPESYVIFDMSKWDKPTEVVVHNPKLKVLMYVCEPANNLLSVQVRSANARIRRKLSEDDGIESAASKGKEKKADSLATAGPDHDEEGDGNADEPPVATASPEESTEATLPFNKNQQNSTPTSDKTLTPKTGPSTPIIQSDADEAKQIDQTKLKNLSADLAKGLSRPGILETASLDTSETSYGPAAELQKRLGPRHEDDPYLVLPPLRSDPAASTRAPPMDVYKWAKSTTEKFATIKGCNPARQRALCQAFFDEQVKLKQSLRLEQTPGGPRQKDEQQVSPSKKIEPNEWENLVNDWKRSSVERWNSYGIRLKFNGKKQPDKLEKKPELIHKKDESLCSRILSMAYKTLFKDSDDEKKPSGSPASASQKPTKEPVGTTSKEVPGLRDEDVKRFVNSLTILTCSQMPTSAEEGASKTTDAPANKQGDVSKREDQKPKKL